MCPFKTIYSLFRSTPLKLCLPVRWTPCKSVLHCLNQNGNMLCFSVYINTSKICFFLRIPYAWACSKLKMFGLIKPDRKRLTDLIFGILGILKILSSVTLLNQAGFGGNPVKDRSQLGGRCLLRYPELCFVGTPALPPAEIKITRHRMLTINHNCIFWQPFLINERTVSTVAASILL